MNVKAVRILAAYLAAAASAFPQGTPAGENGAALIESGSRLYDAIDYLAVLSGETTLLSQVPASKNEIRSALDALGPSPAWPVGAEALDSLIRLALMPGKPLLAAGEGPVSASLYIEPSLCLGASIPLNTSDLLDADLLRVSNETPPAVNVPLALSFGDWIACRSEFTGGKGYWASTGEGSWTNVPLSASETDMNVPTDAWVAAGTPSFTLAVGRGPVSVGRTLAGSMILSDSFDRPDWASAAFHSPSFRIFLMPMELAPDRYLYFHGIAFKPLKNLSIILSEAASVNAPIDLRYLNPAMIYHNYAGWRDRSSYGTEGSPVGTQFGLNLEWVPVPGVKLWGQYAMNQFQTGYELSEYADTASFIPNSLGGLAGAEWVRPLASGYLVVSAEALYANPWLYILENRPISYVWARRELVAPNGHASEWLYGWTGNPYGPDTVAATVDVKYDMPLSHRASLTYRAVAQGTNGEGFLENLRSGGAEEYYPTERSQAVIETPSGRALVQHSLRISGTAVINRYLEAEADLGYYKTVGGTGAGSVLASFALKARLR